MGKPQHAAERGEPELGALIARDHNRAALIIYSVANETPVSDERTDFWVN